MKTVLPSSRSLRLCVILLFASAAFAQNVPAPKDVIGFTPGEDRKLASWAKVVEYFQRLDAASDRVQFQEIGKTTMGAPFVYATISSPENLRNLAKYKAINDKLADPRKIGGARTLLSATGDALSPVVNDGKDRLAGGTGDADRSVRVPSLIKQGKTIVLITCGVHSTEVGSYLSSMLIAHRLASSNEPEIQKILQNTIILLVPSLNPDGVDIVNNWYQKTLGTPYEGTEPPELYHKYVGHDNNRDWYAFTQVETQLTVDKIHNVWRPQIVHDIHQQGQNGSRLFLPPYMQPVEPNVPKQIVEGYTELGNYMAADLRKQGFQGITTNSTYDAWTPARAYSHYHGGVRILSETASARLATPINVKFENLRVPSDDGYDPKVESPNFGPVWRGGEWGLKDITKYMTTAAFSLLNHAADNREAWLKRFYEIGKEAVRPRRNGELFGYALNPSWEGQRIDAILQRAGVEVQGLSNPLPKETGVSDSARIIRADQPYFSFAKAILERQVYPNLLDDKGQPVAPYDVTAHTLPLLMDVKVTPIKVPFETEDRGFGWGSGGSSPPCNGSLNYGIYRSHNASMDEGWTRWVVERYRFMIPGYYRYCSVNYDSILNARIYAGISKDSVGTIIFPDQPAAQILNGYPKGSMPDEYTGGVGEEGVENLKKFVEAGGTLVFLNRSTEFAIEQFNLPIRNVVKGLDRKVFYIPGSILGTELDLTHPIARDMPQQSIAWFENGPVFDIDAGVSSPTVREGSTSNGNSAGALTDVRATDTPATDTIRVIAKYPSDPKQILLSGWALGAEKIAGKAALVEVKIGKGKIILFGFRPQYRGQSLATFPLLFNAISQ